MLSLFSAVRCAVPAALGPLGLRFQFGDLALVVMRPRFEVIGDADAGGALTITLRFQFLDALLGVGQFLSESRIVMKREPVQRVGGFAEFCSVGIALGVMLCGVGPTRTRI